ncbi:MAG: MFS transporter [Chloroflexi bacterium]|nr:MFS transporter [Chloroflexota bacterium]
MKDLLAGRFFYGWVIVGVSFLADLLSAGTGGYTLGLYFATMGRELGWSRTVLSFSRTVSSIVHGAAGPLIGYLVDRFGARPVMVVGALIGAAGLALNAVVQEPWHFYVIYGGIGALGIAEFGNLSNTVALSKWFIRKRGRAIAIATMGVSSGGVVLIPLTSFFIEQWGWRASWVLVGGLVLVLVFVPTLLFMRNTPEEMGQEPDGVAPVPVPAALAGARAPSAMGVERSWTLAEAVRTPAFWLLIPAFNFSGMGLGAMLLHQIPLIQDKGFPEIAASMASLMAFFALCSKLFWGFMVERMHVRYCTMLSFVVAALGLAILSVADSVLLLGLYALVFGVGISAQTIMNPVVWANYFGRGFIGTIRGIVTPFQVLSGAAAPLFAAWVYDSFGSYQAALVTFMGAYALACACMFFARQPQYRARTS